jgi:predicted RNase H-like HicB family nuclease
MNKFEITFLVREAEEGGYYAEGMEAAIFAEGETMEELKKNIKGGIDCFYGDINPPKFVHLHFSKDEVFAV